MSPKISSHSFCADKLKTLADSTRLAVLELLMSGSKNVGEMNAVLKLDQSLLSHHLKVLRNKGFVVAIRDGKAVRYYLAPTVGNTDRAINLGCCLLSLDGR